jgi:hypothetical protein
MNKVYLIIALVLTVYIFFNLTKKIYIESFGWQKSYEPVGSENYRPFSGEIIENPEAKTILGDKRPFIIPHDKGVDNVLPKINYYPNRIRPPPVTETLDELSGAPPITSYRVLAELDYFNNPQPF